MSTLKLNGIGKTYPSGEKALLNISFETRDKEFIAVVGGEASGKSTLLRVIAGLEDATCGEVFIDGKDVSDGDARERDVAMVFRNDNLNPANTVYENMAYGLAIRKAPQVLIDGRVKAAANVLGLSDVLTRKPKTLTAAVRQRVALGRAIVREPKLYLFDEPLNGLDEKLRAETLGLIINLQARMEGTFVYATKNLAEAMAAATRVVVLKNGLLQQIDTPANLYDYPANAYVAFYIGSPTINFIEKAKIEQSDGGYTAVFGGLKFPLAENVVARFENIGEYAGTGKEVILGIRPEDASVVKGGAYKAVVEKAEKGGEPYVEVTLDGGIPMIVRGQTELFRAEGCEINIDLNRLYLFDGKTRLTLLARDGGYKKTEFADADFKPLPFEEEQALLGAKPAGGGKKKR